MFQIKTRLSERGQKKISILMKLAAKSIEKSLKEGVEVYMLPEAANKAPSYEEEKKILIEGISAEGELIGYQYMLDLANTFLERQSMRQAITDDYAEIFSDGETVTAHAGHTQDINEKTKLMYQRRNGSIHTSYPFQGRFLEAIEFGGTWDVKPRTFNNSNQKPWLLRPEPDITTATMFKSTSPFRMYKRALYSNKVRRQIRTLIKTQLRKALK